MLAKLAAGSLPDDVELERVDIKEESGRRGSGGTLLAGEEQNTAAAQLADEVACFANTPGGGALVVGVKNRSGDLLGTNLDRDWLRHAIYTRVDLAPLVEVREINGVRLLIVHVAPAAEPVEDTQGRIRWRVGKNSVPVDRAEWWLHRQDQAGYDSMALATARRVTDVSAGAMAAAHRYLRTSGQDDVADATVADVLRRLCVRTAVSPRPAHSCSVPRTAPTWRCPSWTSTAATSCSGRRTWPASASWSSWPPSRPDRRP